MLNNPMRYLKLSCLLLVVMPVAAAPPFPSVVDGVHPELARELGSPGPNHMLPERQGSKIGNQQAAARVKQVYSDHKILAVQLIEGKARPSTGSKRYPTTVWSSMFSSMAPAVMYSSKP
ncbi:MAG: hypothetical protein U5O39_08255 [Gammaproteobacteria bacterium]|nr:hypothetical protein [Gammaproteobacteria bacterium]